MTSPHLSDQLDGMRHHEHLKQAALGGVAVVVFIITLASIFQ